jgi:ribosomal protein S18 acetylase RimI-like enzyme
MIRGIKEVSAWDVSRFYKELKDEPFLKNLPEYNSFTKDVHYVLVGESDKVLAYGFVRGWDDDWPDKCLGVIVHPAHRNKGYGELLCRFLLLAAKERNILRVRLHAHPDNEPALNLYKKIGFAFSGMKRADGELIGFYCYD